MKRGICVITVIIKIICLCIITAGTPHTAAEMIVMLLEASPVPLIHPFEEAVLTVNSLDDCLQIVNHLVLTRKQVFIYVVQFLREVLRYKEQNRLSVYRLGEGELLESFSD